jgi:hypothetical protein
MQTTKMPNVPLWLSSLIREIISITYHLFKLMIPIIILVKIIDEMGGIEIIGIALQPVMQFVGLPASMGLVWATTLLTNLYGGIIIFITLTSEETLSVAQVTVLGSMMLLAHALPIELRIAQKAGVRILYTFILRVGGALLLGFILHQIYSTGDFLIQQSSPLLKAEIIQDDSLTTWVISQLKALFQVFLVITALITLLRLLKYSGIEKLFVWLLQPLLKLIGS